MGLSSCYTTTNLWLDVCDYYNSGLTFRDVAKCIQENFPDYGMPHGASTSVVIDLYSNPGEYEIAMIIYNMYYELTKLLSEKNEQSQ